jgi:hypothetical protein
MSKLRTVIAASLLFGVSIGDVRAQYFGLRDYVDIFRLSGAGSGFFGTDTAVIGENNLGYSIPLMGTYALPTSPNPGSIQMAFIGINGISSAFGGHLNCTYVYLIEGPRINVDCEGGAVPGRWHKAVVIGQQVSCTAVMPPPAPGAKAMGFAPSDP